MNERDIVVVAASTGGLDALRVLLASMPAELPASMFIVQHIGSHPSTLPSLLQPFSQMPVKHAQQGEKVERSTVYIAPPDLHLILHDGETRLSNGPRENFTRPAADPLFRSAAVAYGPRVVGIVLTGNLDDGAAGLKAIQACGGYTIVQQPSDCVAPEMPQNALDAVGRVDSVVPLKQIGQATVEALTMIGKRRRPRLDGQRQARIEAKIALTGRSSPEEIETIGVPSNLTCPDCGGAVWRIGNDEPLRFRCHTGHAFSAKSLAAKQLECTEAALWAGLRQLEERSMLARTQLKLAEQRNDPELPAVRMLAVQLAEAQQALRTVISAYATPIRKEF